MIDPVALLITWTTYGTWLPGDERGYVSNTLHRGGGFEPKHNQPGTPYTADDAYTRERARSLQEWPTVWLTPPQANVVAHSLVRVAVERGWMVLRAAIMSNHVHVVVTGCPIDGSAVRRILKGNTQADLSKSVGESRRWWTAGGSDRVREGAQSIESTVEYVACQAGVLAEVVENAVVIPERRG
jgi:REP element-mobilizing transposase RayT